jgi:hypothetical protein
LKIDPSAKFRTESKIENPKSKIKRDGREHQIQRRTDQGGRLLSGSRGLPGHDREVPDRQGLLLREWMQTLSLPSQGNQREYQSEVTGTSAIYFNFGISIFDFGMMRFKNISVVLQLIIPVY